MGTFFFRLPGVKFERAMSLGDITFTPSTEFRDQLEPGLQQPRPGQPADPRLEWTREVAGSWGDDSALAVPAENSETAQTLAADAMAVLRFYMRDLVRVNVEIHLIGMTGEVRSGSRDFILLSDADPPQAAPGWSRIGGTIDFTFTRDNIETLSARSAIRWLGQEFRADSRAINASDSASTSIGKQQSPNASSFNKTNISARAITALAMYDLGLRAVDPTLRVLSAVIAVETLYAEPSNGPWKAQTTAIARRIAYLTCGGGCGRTADFCFYSKPGSGLKSILHNILTTADSGQEWRCSAFLHITAPPEVRHVLRYPPLFEMRNVIAHRGRQDLDKKTLNHLIWTADRALSDGIDWLADNPGRQLHELDEDIASAIRT